MARVLLIHVPVGFEEAYPLALASLAAPLRAAGHAVEGLDVARAGLPALSRRVAQGDVDVAALSVWSPGLASARAVIRVLRQSRVRVVVGGPHPTLRPDDLDADVVVQGEGERAILDAVGAAPPRVIPRGPPLDLGALPLPDRRVFHVADYHRDHNPRGRAYTPSVTSRGCLHACAFCSAPALWGRGHRARPAEQVVAEWRALRQDHAVAAVLVEDDLFTQDAGRVQALCEALIATREAAPLPAFELINGVRPETIRPALADLLARAGCTRVALSLESHAPDRLAAMGRGHDLPRIARTVAALRTAGVGVTGYFQVGLPGETRRDRRALFDYAAGLQLDMAHFSLASAWPGTTWDAPPVPVSPAERAALYARWYLHPQRARRAARLLGATPRDLPRMARRLGDWMLRPLEARRADLGEAPP